MLHCNILKDRKMHKQFINSISATAAAWATLTKETVEAQAAHAKSASELLTKGLDQATATELSAIATQAGAASFTASAKATRLVASSVEEAFTQAEPLFAKLPKMPANELLAKAQEQLSKAPEALASLFDQAAEALVPAKATARRTARA
jgi:hypothetical protein